MTQLLILASASPRRRKLLRALGLKFRVVTTNVRERVWPGLTPRRVAERNAALKAQAAARKCSGSRSAGRSASRRAWTQRCGR